MIRLVVSTSNKGKLKELTALTKDFVGRVISKEMLGLADFDIEETGTTLEENAKLKVEGLRQKIQEENLLPGHDPVWILADDTGLFVDALDGAPGVYSARYAGSHDDQANRKKLLRELEGVPEEDRTAHFSTVLAVNQGTGVRFFHGRVDGKILFREEGEGGFGYDPLFFSEELEKSFAQATAEEKNRVSHRGRAYQNWIRSLGND